MRPARYSTLAWLLLSFLLPASAFAQAQITLDKSVSKTSVASGENFTYTLAYSCSSITQACQGGEVTDVLPAGLEYVSSQGSVHTQNLTGSYDSGSRTVSFPFKPTVNAGSVGELTITVRFANGTTPDGTKAVNEATSTVTNGPPVTSNSVTTTATAGKTCVVDKKRLTNPPVIGRPIAYDIGFCTPGGNGQLDLTSGTVIDDLPAGATFLSADAGCVYDAASNTVTCDFPSGVEAKSTKSCAYKTIRVQYDAPPFVIGEQVTNTVRGSGTYFGEVTPTDLGTDGDTITLEEFKPAPNVGGDKQRKFEFLEVDDAPSEQTYYLRPRNTGNVDLDDFTMIDTIPVEMNVTEVTVGTYNRSGLSGVLSYERAGAPGVWTQWTTFDGDSNQRLLVSGLGLAGGDYITRLKWEYGTATSGFNAGSRPEIVADILATDRNGAPVLEDGRTVTNCFDLSGEYDGVTRSSTKCTSFKVVDEAGRPRPDKQITSSGPYIGGSTVSWKVLVRNASTTRTTGALINPIAADLLPAELSYVGGSWAVCGGNVAGAPAPIFEEIDDYDGTGRTLLRWSYTGASALDLAENERVEICFDTVLDDDVLYGDKTNELFLTTNDGPTLGCLDSSSRTDTNDVDGDGDRTEKVCRDTKNVKVASVAGLESTKFVLGSLDADYNRFPDSGETVMGGLADYRLTIKNPGTVPVKDVLIYDILPFIGDEGVLTGQPRLTEWRPNLVDPVTVGDPNITVYYSTSQNPCRPEIKASAGCVSDWSTTPPQDITSVQSLKFDFGGIVLNPQDSLQIEWPMRAPFGSPSGGEIAWNSFAYVTARTDNGRVLPAAEPIKVGIKVFAPSPALVGNFIWYDFDQDGIQDPDEPGFNGVLAELWRDDNNNGIFDPVSPTNPNGDVKTFFTRSGDDQNGTPGFYLFPNVDPADYFIRFEGPNGYTITQQDAGGDNLADSDGNPLTGVTERFNVPPDGIDYSWDLGLYNPNNAALGNFVWYDTDLDGVQDAGEAGVEGVLVTLYDNGGAAVDTVRTNAAGFYAFVDLVPGTYSVGFTQLPAGFVLTSPNVGDDAKDSDADVFTGRTQTVTLAALDFNRTLDAGIVPPATVGDFVWIDLDEDGKQDDGEPGVEGVIVKLYDANGNVVKTTTTDSDGAYEFLVPSGTYTIGFEPPLGYDFTRKDRGNDAKDSDADQTTGKTDPFFVANGSHNPQYDAGLIANVGLVLKKTVYDGHDAGATCGGGEVVSGPKDDPITFCFEVINIGKTFLDDVRLDDPTLGIDRSALSIARGTEPIAPGDTLVLYYETLIDGRYRNTATATANPTDATGDDLPAFGDVSDDDTARVRQSGGSSGGGSGGVESDGGMALLLNQRLFERRTDAFTKEALRAAPAPVVMNESATAAMLPAPAGALAKNGGSSAGFDLARIVPESGPQGSQAYTVTPRDLLGVTNATSVFAADYVRADGVRLGALFGTTSALEIYDHTKQTCDRLGGGALESVQAVEISGGSFVMSELVHATGEVDFAVTFVAYRSGSTFTIDSRFVPDAYAVPAGTDEVLNVQIWAMNPADTEALVAEALAKLGAQGTVAFSEEAEASRVPAVFVRSGRYDGGRLLLDVVNTRRSEQAIRLSGSVASTEVEAQNGSRTAFETNLTVPVLTGDQAFTTVSVETGTLYDISFTLADATAATGDEAARYDRAYAADGTWGTNVGNGTVSAFDVIADESAKQRTDRSYPIARAAYMQGRTSDWASLFRSLRPSWQPVDLDGFDALEMTLSGQGRVQVVVEKASVEGGQHYGVELALTATPTQHRFTLDQFVNASGQAGLTLEDVTAVVFYAVSDGGSKAFTVVAQDLVFTASSSVANEAAGVELPTQVELSGNYPNPFAASTTIGYGLPESGKVRLAVYDLLGREVATLVDGVIPAGRHEATLNASGLASGTYLYRLQTGDRVEVKTLTIVR